MADISIFINADATLRYFDRMPHRLDEAIRGMLTDSSTHFLALMKRYPPTRPSQRYVRTGTLGRSWHTTSVTRTSNGWSTRTGSSGAMAPYNRRVQDRTMQGRHFRGRWLTAQDAVEQQASQVQRFADARIRAALAGA